MIEIKIQLRRNSPKVALLGFHVDCSEQFVLSVCFVFWVAAFSIAKKDFQYD